MLNVKTLTDTMSRMELPQLQQYATLHKNDPYIVTLALSIANQKKQMMASKNGQAGMQPQPKVVDQDIAQIAPRPQPQQMPPQQTAPPQQQALPEDQGIGQLPAQNMQGMAEGGIVAFDDGGSVPGYAGGGVPSGAIIMGNMYQDPVTGQMKYLPGAEPQRSEFAGMSLGDAASKVKDAIKNKLATPSQYISGSERQNIINEQQNKLTTQNHKPRRSEEQLAESDVAQRNNLPDPAATTINTPGAGPVLPPGAAPAVGQDGSRLPPAAVAVPSADADYMSGIDKLLKSSQLAGSMGPKTQLDAKRYSLTPAEMANITPADFVKALESAMPKDPIASPLDARQEALNKANLATRQNTKAEAEKQFKEQGLAFTDTLNKLTSKEKRVQTMEDNQLGMSILEAGLNMMAGESPYAMVNIGKGAQAGTKKYMEIQNQVESYRDKIDETKMKIEEYRRNEANMNARELRGLQRDIDDSVSSGAQAMINLAREQYGLNKQQAISFVSNSMQIQQFNVNQKNQIGIHNQQTAAGIDTAYAQMANQRDIAANQNRTQLGLHALEAKYRAANPAAGSLGFFREIGKGDPVKGMEIYSRSLGPEAKGDEALVASYIKNPTALLALEATDPELARYIKQKIKMQMVQPQTDPGAVNHP